MILGSVNKMMPLKYGIFNNWQWKNLYYFGHMDIIKYIKDWETIRIIHKKI